MSQSAQTLRSIGPFLDPHLLLFTLQKSANAKDTANLQKSIKDKLLLNQKDKAKEFEKAAKAEAQKLLSILGTDEVAKLREDYKLTLESLKKENDVNIRDCQNLQKYTKVLYEQGKYKGKFNTPKPHFCHV